MLSLYCCIYCSGKGEHFEDSYVSKCFTCNGSGCSHNNLFISNLIKIHERALGIKHETTI